MSDKPAALRLANALYAATFAACAYAAVVWVVRLPVFPVREVVVRGQLRHVTRAQVAYLVAQRVKGNFFTTSLAQLRSGFEDLPWVADVGVRRHWPGEIDVTLKEHQAVARWDDTALLDERGRLFYAACDAPLPRFFGQEGMEATMLARYDVFRRALTPLGLTIRWLALSPRQAWRIRLSSGTVVAFGRERVDARMRRLVAVLRSGLPALATAQYVDMRYGDGFAVGAVPPAAEDTASSAAAGGPVASAVQGERKGERRRT
ncbi:MAG: cell division protein FtsQ/DivIB [Betaproteobacteria bacterium]|nr:cell division protein FtsQ/DivIB [Betaproteobacteria bacterium]